MITDKEDFWEKVVKKAKELEFVYTLTQRKENKIIRVISGGIVVETEKCLGGEIVPKSMFDSTFEALSSGKPISQKELLNKYGVYRSAFVMALVSKLDEVVFDPIQKTIRLK
jgi:hypothetical protein